MVSGPTNFTHNVHVGFDPMNGIFTVSKSKLKFLFTIQTIDNCETF